MNQFANGYLLILDRTAAKDFFGCQEDAQRRELLHDLLDDAETAYVNCQGRWQALHEAFCAEQLPASTLDQCLLGGRSLHVGEDFHVCLVRPDVVRAVAEQCGQLDTSSWGELGPLAREVADLYQRAAEIGGAVVFCAAAEEQ